MACLLSGLEPLEESVDDCAGAQQVHDFSVVHPEVCAQLLMSELLLSYRFRFGAAFSINCPRGADSVKARSS